MIHLSWGIINFKVELKSNSFEWENTVQFDTDDDTHKEYTINNMLKLRLVKTSTFINLLLDASIPLLNPITFIFDDIEIFSNVLISINKPFFSYRIPAAPFAIINVDSILHFVVVSQVPTIARFRKILPHEHITAFCGPAKLNTLIF